MFINLVLALVSFYLFPVLKQLLISNPLLLEEEEEEEEGLSVSC
jgi:hypothetical protein